MLNPLVLFFKVVCECIEGCQRRKGDDMEHFEKVECCESELNDAGGDDYSGED